MKSAMLAKIILAQDLDEFLETWHHREIDRYLDLDTSYLDDSDASYENKERFKADLWKRMRTMAEDKLAKLFDAMPEEA